MLPAFGVCARTLTAVYGRPRLGGTEADWANVDASLRDVRMSLLEADVDLRVKVSWRAKAARTR
jgi:signal recognition particle GTPase